MPNDITTGKAAQHRYQSDVVDDGKSLDGLIATSRRAMRFVPNDELAAMTIVATALRDALLALKKWTVDEQGFSIICFCEVRQSPEQRHSDGCVEARKALTAFEELAKALRDGKMEQRA